MCTTWYVYMIGHDSSISCNIKKLETPKCLSKIEYDLELHPTTQMDLKKHNIEKKKQVAKGK